MKDEILEFNYSKPSKKIAEQKSFLTEEMLIESNYVWCRSHDNVNIRKTIGKKQNAS